MVLLHGFFLDGDFPILQQVEWGGWFVYYFLKYTSTEYQDSTFRSRTPCTNGLGNIRPCFSWARLSTDMAGAALDRNGILSTQWCLWNTLNTKLLEWDLSSHSSLDFCDTFHSLTCTRVLHHWSEQRQSFCDCQCQICWYLYHLWHFCPRCSDLSVLLIEDIFARSIPSTVARPSRSAFQAQPQGPTASKVAAHRFPIQRSSKTPTADLWGILPYWSLRKINFRMAQLQ